MEGVSPALPRLNRPLGHNINAIETFFNSFIQPVLNYVLQVFGYALHIISTYLCGGSKVIPLEITHDKMIV